IIGHILEVRQNRFLMLTFQIFGVMEFLSAIYDNQIP
ncbi:hypothetical protein JD844_008758, partial [Phrynosoma platyrhinos]